MKSKRSLILFLIICIMTCVGIFTLTACGTNKPNNPDNNQGTNHSAPVAGHFELDEKPLLYNNVIISKLDYDFYLDGGVEATIYVSAQNGYSTIEHKIGRYTWTEGTDLIYISWSDSSEVIDLLYTDKYITNGTYICNFKCANDKGEVAGKLICADYLTKTEKWYELNTTGGTISGGKTQYIKKGGDALTVTAVANDGFEFVGWSDGVNTAERTDKNLTSNLKITAKFKQVKDIFKLEYSAGQGGTLTGKDYQEIVEEKTASSVIAVPDAGNDEYGYEFIG